jgi:hypothetical protein
VSELGVGCANAHDPDLDFGIDTFPTQALREELGREFCRPIRHEVRKFGANPIRRTVYNVTDSVPFGPIGNNHPLQTDSAG